jgi:hypothetical protein
MAEFVSLPSLNGMILRIAGSVLAGRTRSFKSDAVREISHLSPPVQIIGRENIPVEGPCLVTVNHYSRAGFWGWWLAMMVSAAVPVEIHWVTSRELTYPGQKRGVVLRPLTRLGMQWISQAYDFTVMPAMPPVPADAIDRSVAVRHLFRYIHSAKKPVVGLAPEGMDYPGGILGWPPTGSGRMIQQIARQGLGIAPVGAYEDQGVFYLRFGEAYRLESPANLSRGDLDKGTRCTVMQHIARLLPPGLRGEFG